MPPVVARAPRLAGLVLAAPLLILVFAISAGRASAEVLAGLEVVIRFEGDCAVNGVVRIVNVTEGYRLPDKGVRWSAERPIEIHGFGGADKPRDVLRLTLLDARGGARLYSARLAWSGSGSEYYATLDCSTVPYVLTMPDAAAARSEPSLVAGLGVGLVVAGTLCALVPWRRSSREPVLTREPVEALAERNSRVM